jgi:hypothetical protein
MLTIISFNIRGISSNSKYALLKSWLYETQHDIVLSQKLAISSIATCEAQRQTAFSIGNYLYSIWLYRSISINKHLNDYGDACKRIFMTPMQHLFNDNG